MNQRTRLNVQVWTGLLLGMVTLATAVAEPPRRGRSGQGQRHAGHGERHQFAAESPDHQLPHAGRRWPQHGLDRGGVADLSLGFYGWGGAEVVLPSTRSRASFSYYDMGPPAWQPDWQPGTVITFGRPSEDGRPTVNVAEPGGPSARFGWAPPQIAPTMSPWPADRGRRPEFLAAWQQLLRGDVERATIAFHEQAAAAPQDGVPQFGVGVASLVQQSETTALWSLRRAVRLAGSDLRDLGLDDDGRAWLQDLAVAWSEAGRLAESDRLFATALLRYVAGDENGALRDVAAARAAGDEAESTLRLAELVGAMAADRGQPAPAPNDVFQQPTSPAGR